MEKSERRGKKRKRGTDQEKAVPASRPQIKGHRGALYNTYKHWRGLIKKTTVRESHDSSDEEQEIPPVDGKFFCS